MLAVEQHFSVCHEEIISNKNYGAKSVRKSGEYHRRSQGARAPQLKYHQRQKIPTT